MKKIMILIMLTFMLAGCTTSQIGNRIYEKGKKVYHVGKKAHNVLENAGTAARKAEKVYLEYNVEKEKKALE